MANRPERFVALDSLRGVCALMVALFHFPNNGLIASNPLVRSGELFVDFFFVLSGFVIATAYADRLEDSRGLARFMALRFGRIYPLHVAILLLLLVQELVLVCVGGADFIQREPFTGNREPEALVWTATLMNSFGAFGPFGWNRPSWSIAAELWTYLVFALIMVGCGRHGRRAMLVLGLASMLILAMEAPRGLLTTNEFGLVRCLFGFGLGVWVAGLPRLRTFGGAVPEVAAIVGAVLFLCLVGEGPATLLAPFLFAAVVLCFAQERGPLSAGLRHPWLVALGTWSFSLYMLHSWVQARFLDVVQLAGLGLGRTLTGWSASGRKVLVADPLVSDLLTVAMLALLIAAARLGFELVETPCRAWTRRQVDRLECLSDAREKAEA